MAAPLESLDNAKAASAFGLRRPKLALTGVPDSHSAMNTLRPVSAASLPTISSGTRRPCSSMSAASLQLQGRLTPLMRAEYQQLVFPAQPKSPLQKSRSRAILLNHYPELLSDN